MVSTWLCKRTDSEYKLIFFHKRLIPLILHRSSSFLGVIVLFLSIPNIRILLVMHTTPSNLFRICYKFFWQILLDTFGPKSRRLQLYQPHDVPKIVIRLNFSSNSSCQNVLSRSIAVKRLARPNWGRTSSETGNLYRSLRSVSYNGCGLMFMRRPSSVFLTTMIWLTQYVGWSTCLIKPHGTHCYGSVLKFSWNAIAICFPSIYKRNRAFHQEQQIICEWLHHCLHSCQTNRGWCL